MAECKSRFAVSFSRVVHAGDSCQFTLKVQDRPKIGILPIEVGKRAPEQIKQFRLTMISLGADFDQLDEIGTRLHAQLIPTNSGERVIDDNLGQGVQIRPSTWDDGNVRFKKEIELSSKWRFGAARALGHGLNVAARLGAP